MKSVAERRVMVESPHVELSLVEQCALLSISRSGFYYEPVTESEENLAIMRMLDGLLRAG